MRRVYQECLASSTSEGQDDLDLGKNTIVVLAFPGIVEGCYWPRFFLRVATPHPIKIYEDSIAYGAKVTDVELSIAFGSERFLKPHLGVGQPVMIANRTDLPAGPE